MFDLIVFAYVVLCIGLAWIFKFPLNTEVVYDFKYAPIFLLTLAQFLVFFLMIRGFVLFFQKKDKEIFGPVWRDEVFKQYLKPRVFADFMRIFVLLQLMLAAHALVKQAIPLINPRLYDTSLVWLDTTIHGGYNPVLLLGSLITNKTAIWFIDTSYVFWYQIMLPCFAIFILTKRRELFKAFFSAYFLLWLIGGICTLLLPSWGPVYYYPEWMSTIARPQALVLQQKLWLGYSSAIQNPAAFKAATFEGIAAFPSLHVGVIVLFAYFLKYIHSALVWFMAGFALLIQIGSVFLGWHYAIDGYFSAILAILLARICCSYYGVSRQHTNG